MAGSEGVFLVLFIVATTVAIIVRWLRVPYTVALVLAGLALGQVSVFEAPTLTRELLFSVFLPGLLFEAAFHIDFREFQRNRLSIAALAVPGVAASILLTALILTPVANALAFVQGFDWRHALVFGALISATDPVAVLAIFRSLGVPRRLAVLLEGESLLNDGTAIVFFSLALAVVSGGGVTAGRLALDFVTVVGVGAFVGAAVGLVASEVIKRVDDPMIEIALTTIAAYGSFVVADQFHYSGVIATVAAGLVCGNYTARGAMSPSSRVSAETFWEYVVFALNSIVFLLIGLEVKVGALLASWQPILVAYCTVTLGRGLVILVVSALLRPTRERIPASWSAVLGWGGLRGGLPMVLVLSLAADFPHRALLVSMTFGVVILSILLQGVTMAPVMRILGTGRRREAEVAYELERGRLAAAHAALQELARLSKGRLADAELLGSLRDEYERLIGSAQERIQSLHVDQAHLEEEELRWVRRRLMLVEKDRLIDALHQGQLGQAAYEKLVAELDARLLELESGRGADSAGEPPEAGP